MVKKHYTIQIEGPHAKAMLKNTPISTKWAREVARAIKGMNLRKAVEYLERVLEHRDWIPAKRYNKKVAHRKGVKEGVKSGRYMDKTVKYFLKLLRNVESNAEQAGLDPSNVKIVHVWVGKGFRRLKRQPKGMWRIRRSKSTHIEVVVR